MISLASCLLTFVNWPLRSCPVMPLAELPFAFAAFVVDGFCVGGFDLTAGLPKGVDLALVVVVALAVALGVVFTAFAGAFFAGIAISLAELSVKPLLPTIGTVQCKTPTAVQDPAERDLHNRTLNRRS